jgi:N-terminal domain of (some) glycogen debranching enzymes/Glycosyltransferase Family 4
VVPRPGIVGTPMVERLTIALVAPLYEPVPPALYGGTERVVAYLSDELVRRGHQVTVFGSGDLTNPDIVGAEPVIANGAEDRLTVPGRMFHVRRLITIYRDHLYQTAAIESFAREPHSFEIGWAFEADFADVFEVRGYLRPRRGLLLPARIEKTSVVLAYRGAR